MDPFECYTYEEAIGHETVFIIRHPQGYSRLINNIQRVYYQVYNYKIKLERVPRQIDQTTDTPQGGKYSLKFVMLCCAEEVKLGDRKESSYRRLISTHKGEFTKPFENLIT